MESGTLRKWLAEHGCRFEQHERGEGGHAVITVRRGSLRSELPLVGTRKRLDPEVVARIRRELDLMDVPLPEQ